MKVIKFRIKNYKSIEDSGWCYLDERITILAGKNEAGKTAILEALEDFNINKNIREEAKPIWDGEVIPEIEIEIELNKDERKEIEELLGSKLNKSNIHISKKFPNQYTISNFDEIIGNQKNLDKIKKEAESLIHLLTSKLQNFPIKPELLKNPQNLLTTLNQYQLQFIPNLQPQEVEKIKQDFEKLKQSVNNLIDLNPNKFLEIVKRYLPNFILFKTFEDILPDSIPISQAQTTPIISDLGIVTDFDFSKIQPTIDMAVRAKEKEKINLKFREEYAEFWTQDNAHLYVDFDSSNIYFLFKEGDHFFKPKMRSKGKQWHFAFYVRVTARSVEEKRNVILIDEPGLFLHAKAQKEILKKLKEVSSKAQIIYTTHSPYLIPSSELYRVRLVIKKKEDRGTVIEKITAKADKETLSPILTAIGEDLTVGIRVDRKNSIVVEGYSDYLWLVSWKNLLNITEELNFIPAVGGGSTVHVGSILFGWGLDPIFVLDNDQQGKEAKKKLEKELGIEGERILLIPFEKDGEIEDLYSDEEKKKLGITSKNKKSKTIIAHQFLQQVEREEIKTEDFPEARENFKKLFERLINIVKGT